VATGGSSASRSTVTPGDVQPDTSLTHPRRPLVLAGIAVWAVIEPFIDRFDEKRERKGKHD